MSNEQDDRVLFQSSHSCGDKKSFLNGQISVIVPLYKPELDQLTTAIYSIVNQTCAATEIICVSDGIPLDSKVSTFLNSIDNLRVIELKANVGQGSARNRGMEEAVGDWVAFLDQDDYWYPEHLAVLLAECLHRSCTFAYTDIAFVNKDALLVHASARNLLQLTGAFDPIKKTIASVFLHDLVIFPTASLVHRHSALEVGGFGEGYRGYEDDHLFGKLILRYGDHAFINQVTCAWRSHSNGTSMSLSMSRSRILYAEFLQESLRGLEIDKNTLSPENIFNRFYPQILGEFHKSYKDQTADFLVLTGLIRKYLDMSARFVKLSNRQKALLFLTSLLNYKILYKTISYLHHISSIFRRF